MENLKINDVVTLMENSVNYLYKQDKLFIYINNKTHIIHNVNQKSYEYILSKINSKVSNLVEIKVTRPLKSSGEKWSHEEDQIILNNFDNIEFLCDILTERTKKAIMERRGKLRIKD